MRTIAASTLLLVLACSETPTPSPVDAGSVDGGVADTGSLDAPAADARVDSGVDAGVLDVGAEDATPGDTDPWPMEACDRLQPEVCTFPWPSNLYLAPDSSRQTGWTLRFAPDSLPANRSGRYVDPAPYARMDGYGLGTPIMVFFADLNAATLPDENAIARSLDADASILIFEEGLKGAITRVPYFAELDSNESDPTKKVLFVRPARLLTPGRRYLVAIRGLRDRSGVEYAPSPAFAALRSGTADQLLAIRQPRFNQVFQHLEGLGVDVSALQLAWDFNTASDSALTGKLLAMRDDALARVGASGPAPVITSVQQYVASDDGSGMPIDADMRYRIEGTVTVPSYTTGKMIEGLTHTVLNLDPHGVPVANGTHEVKFWMIVPHSITTTAAHGLIQYGHGLLGSGEQTMGGHNKVIANQHHYLFVGCDLTGFSELDQVPVAIAVRNMSGFEWIADTIHQGLIDYLVVGRAVQQHLAAIVPVVANLEPARFHYSGISQGGIFGGTYMAISSDVTRGHLGVAGLNYSLLLYRSVDFTPFFDMMRTAYPESVDHAVLLAAAQLLWDGTDPVSYYRHISSELLANTPEHHVLVAPAKGDYQVAPLSIEIAARTLGEGSLPLLAGYDDERTPFGLIEAAYPHTGSGVVLYDFGNPWPPAGNLPPDDGLSDPHGLPRRLPAHNVQMDHFFRTGEIIDVCGGDGCHPD